MSTLVSLLLMAPAWAAPPPEQALTELLQAGGLLDQMAWIEDHLPAVQDPEEREAWKRIWDALLIATEELGTKTPPMGWEEVVRTAAAPSSPEALKAVLGAWLLGTTPEGREPTPTDRYREGRLALLHPVFDYYEVVPDVANVGGIPVAGGARILERHFDEVLVVDGLGRDLDPGQVAERLSPEDPERWTPRRMRRDEASLRVELQRANQVLAAEIGLDPATVAAVESGAPAVHWSELVPLCPSLMPAMNFLFHSPDWTREIEAAAQPIPGLGEACRVPRTRAEAVEEEPEG